MTFWLALNSAGIVILGAVTFLILRQLGFVLQRAGPSGARMTNEGPRVGENVSPLFPAAATKNGKSKLVVFLSDHCSVCKLVRAGAEPLAKVWKQDSEIYLVYDTESRDSETEFELIAPGLQVRRAFRLREALGASFVPFAAVMSPDGVVVGKALVNEIAHLESLLEQERADRNTRPNDRERWVERESGLGAQTS